MGVYFRPIWATLAALAMALTVRADCGSYGVDYSNGGSYYIDGSSNQYFSFITVFQGTDILSAYGTIYSIHARLHFRKYQSSTCIA